MADVDRTGSPALFVEYLDRVRSSPHRLAWKSETLDLLRLGPGECCLDLGCGTGEDVAAMVTHVGEGLAIGIDRSLALTATAAERHRTRRVCFLVADAAQLPFVSEAFSGIRVERTLQTVAEPSAVIDEALRVLRPGGRLVALEPDWETLVYPSPLEATSRALAGYRINRKPARTIGRHLGRLMANDGLVVERVEPRVATVTSFEQARYAFNADAVVEAAVTEGVISGPDGAAWFESLQSVDAGGGFIASVTNFLALGRKPS